MTRNEVENKLNNKGFSEQEITDVMKEIPKGENDIDQLKITVILVSAQFPADEITRVCAALFH